MQFYAGLAGAWRRAKGLYLGTGGGWVRAKQVWFYDGAAWRQVWGEPRGFSGEPTASALASNPTDVSFAWTLNGDAGDAEVRVLDSVGTPLATGINPAAGSYVLSSANPFVAYALQIRGADGLVIATSGDIFPNTGV